MPMNETQQLKILLLQIAESLEEAEDMFDWIGEPEKEKTEGTPVIELVQ